MKINSFENPFVLRPATWLSLALTLLLVTACGRNPSAADPPGAHAEDEQEHDEAEHAEGATDHVELTPEQMKNAEIGLAQAGPAEIGEHLPLYGVIAPDAERVRQVTPRFPGVIRAIGKRVGDAVRGGEILATVESNESLQSYAVVAPLDGVVTMRDANVGEQTGERPLFTVADLSTVWVEVSVFPRDVGKIRVGQTARVRSADTSLRSDGKVIYIAPFGSTSNQTLTARVQLENRNRNWRPGLYVTAEVMLSNTKVPLAVASESLQSLEGRAVVFVMGEHGFEPRAVEPGRSDEAFTEVLAGLRPGETYATKNSFIVKAELGKGEAEHEH